MSASRSDRRGSESGDDDTPVAYATVPEKYRGTIYDRQDMSVLGKKQVLKRQFRFTSMLGFASTVMVAWEFVLLVSPFGLVDGGTPVVFWGLLLSPIILLPTYASLAEVASMSPTAGGQYHWVSELAPPQFQKGLSYSVGWLVALGWQTFLAGVSFEVATLILGLAVLGNPSYVILSWHQTLLTMGIVIFGALVNVFLNKHLPTVEIIVLIFHTLGVFVVILPLWVMAPHGNAQDTIFNFTNTGGWFHDGLSYAIGIAPIIGLLIGYDCSVHMSEETNDASRTIPVVVVTAVGVNAIMLIVVGFTFIFCLGDLSSALGSSTGQPVVQVFYNATGSVAGTCVMVAVIVIILISACIGQLATTSRQLWSFARDKGFPGSPWISRVPSGYNIPINALAVSTTITCLLSLINLGSYTAFNAFNSLGSISILFSYTITIGCLVWRRLFGASLPQRRWSLGRWGLPLNIFTLCFTSPIFFFYTWPIYYPVTPSNMNWSSTMFGGVLFIAGLYYLLKGRHDYHGPVVLVKRK